MEQQHSKALGNPTTHFIKGDIQSSNRIKGQVAFGNSGPRKATQCKVASDR